MNPLTTFLAMAKGLDIATASFIAIGWTLIEKEQFIYAFISFAFAFISGIVTVICKTKYHYKDEAQKCKKSVKKSAKKTTNSQEEV